MESVPEDDTLLLLRGSDAVSVVTTNAVKNGWQPPRRKKVNFKNINVGRFLRRLSQKARNRLEKYSSLHFFLIFSQTKKYSILFHQQQTIINLILSCRTPRPPLKQRTVCVCACVCVCVCVHPRLAVRTHSFLFVHLNFPESMDLSSLLEKAMAVASPEEVEASLKAIIASKGDVAETGEEPPIAETGEEPPTAENQ